MKKPKEHRIKGHLPDCLWEVQNCDCGFVPDDWESMVIEELACIEHKQWETWARSLIKSGEKLSSDRLDRWANLFVPYSQLNEKQKEQDRKWARKILPIIRSLLVKKSKRI